jgi:hypothetical protein
MDFDRTIPEEDFIAEVRESNQHRIADFAQRGIQVTPDRSAQVLERLLDIFDPKSDARLGWEREYALQVADLLDGIDSQIRLQMITQGVTVAPQVLEQVKGR